MSIKIIPTGSSAVVTEKHHDRHGGDRRWDETILREELAAARVAAQTHTETITAVKDARYGLTQVGERGIAATSLASAHTNERMADCCCELKGTIATAASDVVAVVNHVGEETQENFAALTSRVADVDRNALSNFKDLTSLGYQVEGRSLLESAKNTAALSVQADKNNSQVQLQAQMFNAQSQLQAQTFAAAAALQAQTIASAGVLQAQQIASAQAAALAECCCELKGLIKSDGEKTRDLLSEQNTERLRDRAARAEQKLAAYYSAQKMPVCP